MLELNLVAVFQKSPLKKCAVRYSFRGPQYFSKRNVRRAAVSPMGKVWRRLKSRLRVLPRVRGWALRAHVPGRHARGGATLRSLTRQSNRQHKRRAENQHGHEEEDDHNAHAVASGCSARLGPCKTLVNR
jgi:hypothetical protein